MSDRLSSCASTKPSPCEEASPLPSVGLLESKYLRNGAEVTASLILSKATSCSFVQNDDDVPSGPYADFTLPFQSFQVLVKFHLKNFRSWGDSKRHSVKAIPPPGCLKDS